MSRLTIAGARRRFTPCRQAAWAGANRSRFASVHVVVVIVSCVPVSVVNVVDLVAVRDAYVAAPLAVHVVMPFVQHVASGFAFVAVIAVPSSSSAPKGPLTLT